MFTQREVQILKAILDLIDKKGYSPTVREIGEAVNLSSTSTVHKYLENLENKGCINRAKSSPRALSVTEKGLELIKLLE